MAYFLLKTEPSTYSWDDLVKAKKATWDGVANPAAVRNIRNARKGDLVAIYHTGDEKSAVGIAEVVSDPYDDPKDAKLAVFDLAPRQKLAEKVTLAQIKAAKEFAESPLVKMGRLSVVALDATQWKALLALAKTKLQA
jgi:predicted RNA-binding protein with PUA-like domain